MKVEMTPGMLRTLVSGVYPPMHICDELVKIGAMRFTGNQHNPEWCWESSYLKRLSEEELLALYEKYK
jgi:hypothetical protein